MKVVNVNDLDGTEDDVIHGNWQSRRMVLAKDKVGFSFHITILKEGTSSDFWYANHVEAVYVYQGKGTLTDRDTGEKYDLKPGVMYMLDDADKHTVTVEEEIHCACVFNPPVTGREVHDENGVYPLVLEA